MMPGLIAGSISAVAAGERAPFIETLVAEGLHVHVELMANGARAALIDLQAAATAIGLGRLSVQLTGSNDCIDDILDDVLAMRPVRVYLPWAAFTHRRAETIRAADVRACIAIWNECDHTTGSPRWITDPNGVLVMLNPPGTREPCQPHRLAIVITCIAHFPAIPVAVAGNITEDIAAQCRSAGVQQIVVAEALLSAAAPG